MPTLDEMLASPWGTLGQPTSNYDINRVAENSHSGYAEAQWADPRNVYDFMSGGQKYVRTGAPWESVYGGSNTQYFTGDPATYGAFTPEHGMGLRADIYEGMRKATEDANYDPPWKYMAALAGLAGGAGLAAGAFSGAGAGVGAAAEGAAGAAGTGAFDVAGSAGLESAFGIAPGVDTAAFGGTAGMGAGGAGGGPVEPGAATGAADAAAAEVGGVMGGADLGAGTGAFDMAGSAGLESGFGINPGVDSGMFPSSGLPSGSSFGIDNMPSGSMQNVTKAATETATKGAEKTTLQNAWDSLTKDPFGSALKFGPLALGAVGMMNQQSAADKFREQLAQIGGPQRAIGEQLLADYQAGRMRPADTGRIAAWEASALAQAKQFYSRAGLSTSTSANTTYSDIATRAEQMKQQALESNLKAGLEALNITDRYQAMALQAEMQADQQAAAAGMNFLNAYGSWLRALPQMTGQAAAK